ncbi:MAG: putative bifunctional diguanylate cyclase/phosphodiesterase [Actinomycetota bacterium]
MKKMSLLTKFGLISMLPIVALGLVLSHILEGFVRDRAILTARQSIEAAARVGVQPLIRDQDLSEGFSELEYERLDTLLHGEALLDGAAGGYKIFNRDLEVVYSADRSELGSDGHGEHLTAALAGRTTATVRTGSLEGEEVRQLYVFVPVQTRDGPNAVVQIALPYEPIARAIETDARQLQGVLLAGLLLLYLALFRIVADASRRLRKQAKVNEYQAFHDVLTGLANRGLFRDRVQQAVREGERENRLVALMLMDLDRFKEINDTLGHHKGDLVLQQVSGRLNEVLRDTDTVARLGGDEFAVLLPHIPDPAAALHVADKIQIALRQPFVIEGLALDVRASIGVSFFPGHGDDVDLLLQRADVAMYLAKAANSGCEVYAAERDQYSASRLALATELRRAMDGEEFVLFYQPKVDLRTGETVVVEALCRWDHPTRGMIPPSEFIPLAEHTGLIEPLTMYVLDKALRQVRQWREQGVDLTVAVNMSPRNLLDLNFPDHVETLLKKWQLPPGALQLEITESTLVADPTRAMAILSRLNQIRVEMSIDDFGTGYSSLGHLRKLPVKELKIDKSFVLNMGIDESDAIIVRSTIDLGRNLGLRVVAEGVETAEIWRQLVRLGCDYAQGYYQSRPMPAEEMPRWLSLSQPRWPL